MPSQPASGERARAPTALNTTGKRKGGPDQEGKEAVKKRLIRSTNRMLYFGSAAFVNEGCRKAYTARLPKNCPLRSTAFLDKKQTEMTPVPKPWSMDDVKRIVAQEKKRQTEPKRRRRRG